nr:hypothetical protein [Marixanthomonas sp. SCSIO 43207]
MAGYNTLSKEEKPTLMLMELHPFLEMLCLAWP